MSEGRWDKVGSLLEEARELSPERRKAFLEERCEDPALREEVLSLLKVEEEAEGFFEDLGSAVPPALEDLPSEAEETGGSDERGANKQPPNLQNSDPLGLEDTKVGRYEVERCLGGGGMGIVYKAYDPELDRTVALKFLPPYLAASREAEERFKREAKAAAALEHPNIATIYEVGEAEGAEASRRFIAMACYEGETLKEKLEREGPLPIEEAIGYAIQIAKALERAHEAGIVHRDVKPANVMITGRGEVKLLDFGLAKAASETGITDPGRRLGTASYMSPEQARGEEVGPRADLWALGALLYEMLAGRRPFQGERPPSVIHSVLHEEPKPLSEQREEVGPKLQRVARRCLQKDPDKRYEMAQELLKDLWALKKKEAMATRASSSGQTSGLLWPEVMPEAFRPRSLSNGRTGDRWLMGGAGVLIALLFALGWALWPGGPPTDLTPETTKAPPQSIAVLPFETIGAGEASAFTDGIHGDVLTRLSNISELKVISRTSVHQYRDTQKPITKIGEELGAAWVLEGEVQEAGGKVQVNARLISARSDQQAWAREYQRELTAEKFFAIQEEITRDIAEALEAQVTAGEKKRIASAPTEDLEAYRLYVQGRQELARRGFSYDKHVDQAVRYFRKAIKRDSSFALAWAGLADAAATRIYEVPDSALASRINQEEAARRALKLDPDLAEAHASMGYVHYMNQNAPATLRELRRALELKPSYWDAHQLLGWLYFILDRPQEALDHFQLAVELNPQHALARHGLYDAYHGTGQPRKSLQEARRQQRMDLEETSAIGGEVRALTQLGQFQEARRLAKEQIKGLSAGSFWGGWFRVYLTGILAAEGDTSGARKYLGQLQKADVSPEMIANAYRNLGEGEKALEAIHQLEGEDWWFLPMSIIRGLGEEYPSLRDDPRYREVLHRANQTWGLNPDGSLPENASSEASR